MKTLAVFDPEADTKQCVSAAIRSARLTFGSSYSFITAMADNQANPKSQVQPMDTDPAPSQTQAGPSNAAASTSTAQAQAANQPPSADVASIIGQLMKQQFGDNISIEKIAHVLRQNMDHFAKQGKLTPAQIQQVRRLSFVSCSLN